MSSDLFKTTWNILAIDDSKLNRAIIKKVLSQLNMNVDEAMDGLEGISALKKNKYDLVLVDIIMPNLDGFGFLAKFKEVVNENNFIPVILMTGSDDLNSKIKGLQIGADDFLLKPLNEKELVARVLSLLRLKSANSELYEKNELIKKELEVAKRVQEFIIPKEFTAIKYPTVCGRYLPIEDIGGDYFDCYILPNEKIGFLIADVTGHGIPAALVMAMSKMLFSIYSTRSSSSRELLATVNNKMKGLLLDMQYITSFYAIYDHKTKELQYSNAGHTRGLYLKSSMNKVLALDTKGFFIGISESQFYENKTVKVEKGDRFLLYTDGITELKNHANDEFGEKRLARFMIDHMDADGEQFCDLLLKELKSFTSLEDRKDDLAFLYIEF